MNGIHQNIHAVLRYLPLTIRSALERMQLLEEMQEIRLRIGRPIGITMNGAEQWLCANGTRTSQPEQALIVTDRALQDTFQAICEYSVYHYTKELTEGFITIKGGNRVGIAGTAVYKEGKLSQLKSISSLNIRFARSVPGCAISILERLHQRLPDSLLLVGPVGSGKTTVLRDLCRLVGRQEKVTLVDERGELAAVWHGMPQHDVGLHTDIYDGFTRWEGILTGLRVMTPSYLVCDEISTEQDRDALLQVHGCGVKLLATAHAASIADAYQRPQLQRLLQEQVFSHICLLGTGAACGTVQAIQEVQRT